MSPLVVTPLPNQLIKQLQTSTNKTNDTLLEILSIVRTLKVQTATATTTNTKSSSSSLASITRGLYTKNNKLLTLINNQLINLESIEQNDQLQSFKNFLNQVIIWYNEEDVYLLYQKYSTLISLVLVDSLDKIKSKISAKLMEPVQNTDNLISFIKQCATYIRNPFILEKLNTISHQLELINTNFANNNKDKQLSSIQFDKVRSFNASSSSTKLKGNDLVSSYFSINQIVHRTCNAQITLNKEPVELVLLDLIGNGKDNTTNNENYNALAILKIEKIMARNTNINSTRYLLYPPFRVNELSISHSDNYIHLKSINFLSLNAETGMMRLDFENSQLCNTWAYYLSHICPLEINKTLDKNKQFLLSSSSDEAINSKLAITRGNGKNNENGEEKRRGQGHENENEIGNEYQMSGLGINLVSDLEHKKLLSSEETIVLQTPVRSTFKELISSPSISPKKPPTAQKPQNQVLLEENVNGKIKASKSHIKNNAEDSLRSQYRQSLDLIRKTISDYPTPCVPYEEETNENKMNALNAQEGKGDGEGEERNEEDEVDIIEDDGVEEKEEDDERLFHIVNRRKLSDDLTGSRPVSYQAEVVKCEVSPESHQSITSAPDSIKENEIKVPNLLIPATTYKGRFADSVPDLSLKKPNTKKIFELSNGSAIDIAHFGQSHTPEFVRPGLPSFQSTESHMKLKQKPRKRSIFSIFKKGDAGSAPTSISASIPAATTTTINTTTTTSSSSSAFLTELTPREELEGIEDGAQTETRVESQNTKEYSTDASGDVSSTQIEKTSKENDESMTRSNSDLVSSATRQERVSKLPGPFALPSSTSMQFFKPHLNGSAISIQQNSGTNGNVNGTINANGIGAGASLSPEKALEIPQDLKDEINLESTEDFYISQSSPRSMKISKWKAKYGKWEMLTTAESIFVKIVLDINTHKCWFIVFKEEFDQNENETIDVPVLLLDLNSSFTKARSSSALDMQLTSINSITGERMLIMIRCTSGSLINEMLSNLEAALVKTTKPTRAFGSLHNLLQASLQGSHGLTSNNTLSSSIMDRNPSKSSTFTSLSSINSSCAGKTLLQKHTINTYEVYNSCVMNNPSSTRHRELETTIRLQKQLNSFSDINNPSSWKILSMCDLSIDKVNDPLTHVVHYHIQLSSNEDIESDEKQPSQYSWLISDENKSQIVLKIGRAGLLVKVSEDEIYMLECKGKKEFKRLYEIF